MFSLGERSLTNLQGVHPDLVKLVQESIKDSPYDFAVIEGVRTKQRQQELYNAGKSQTLMSRHLTGKAIDLMLYVNGVASWENKYYQELAKHVKSKAQVLGIKIIWGGDWRSLVDAVHFELDKAYYP